MGSCKTSIAAADITAAWMLHSSPFDFLIDDIYVFIYLFIDIMYLNKYLLLIWMLRLI
jgi:hypothetical protein